MRRLHEFPVQAALKCGIQQDHRNLTDIAPRKVKLEGFLSKVVEHFMEFTGQACTAHLDIILVRHASIMSRDKNLYRLPKWTRTSSHCRLGAYLSIQVKFYWDKYKLYNCHITMKQQRF
ncbi:hypothetical protein QUF95_08760 [Paenibacillus silvae]|nr:hypothetical protein [Paenibacillus silvae]